MRLRALVLSLAMISLVAACGNDDTSSANPTSTTAAGASAPSTTASPNALPKPDVKIPASLPTQLVATDLKEGTGAGAVNGDTLVVHYVGVRSADGTEFDSSYAHGTPLPVTLGVGQVIKGWDQGLVGVKAGGRRQLDIPSDLAYGDKPQGDVIKAGDALTFVIDVLAIIPKPNPADQPNISVPPTPNQAEQTFTDLKVGEGEQIAQGKTVVIQFLAFSAKDGKLIDSSWTSGAPLTFVPGGGQLPPGLEKAVDGMKVGGRRQVDIPFADAFGADGNQQLGLPPSTDLIMVIDLVGVY